MEGVGSGTKWGPSVGDPSATETKAGGSVVGQRHLVGILENTKTRPRVFPSGIFRVLGFFPFSQQGCVTIRTPCPLIGLCSDTAGYQRAQPRQENKPPKKELLFHKALPHTGTSSLTVQRSRPSPHH